MSRGISPHIKAIQDSIRAEGYAELISCEFQGNRVWDLLEPYGEGGAVSITDMGTVQFTNCLLARNLADDGAGLSVASDSGNLEVVNCTFADNLADVDGGGAHLSVVTNGFFVASFTNSILWGNEDDCETSCQSDELSQIFVASGASTPLVLADFCDTGRMSG